MDKADNNKKTNKRKHRVSKGRHFIPLLLLLFAFAVGAFGAGGAAVSYAAVPANDTPNPSNSGYMRVPHDVSHEEGGSAHGIMYHEGSNYKSAEAQCLYINDSEQEQCYYYDMPEIYLFADDASYDGTPHGGHFAWSSLSQKMQEGFPNIVQVPGSELGGTSYSGNTAAGEYYFETEAPTLPGEYEANALVCFKNMGDLYDSQHDRDAYCQLSVPYSIKPREITLDWENTEFDYDGAPHMPDVMIPAGQIIGNDEVHVSISPAIKPGEHTAEAVLTGKDSWKYTIAKESRTKTFYIIAQEYDVIFDANLPDEASTKDIAKTTDPDTGERKKQHFNHETAPGPLAENIYVLPGYEFIGWNTRPDGTGTHYDDKAQLDEHLTKADATVTLYAMWNACGYKIIFKPSSDSSVSHTQDAVFDMSGTLDQYDENSADWWSCPSGRALHGWDWTIGTRTVFYGNGAVYLNLVKTDETGAPLLNGDGTIQGATLIANTFETETITATVSLDGKPQPGLNDCFTLVSINGDGTSGAIFHIPGEYVRYSAGVYTFEPESEYEYGNIPDQIPPGDYDLVFEAGRSAEYGDPFPDGSRRIKYGEDDAVSAVFDFYTVSIQPDPADAEHHSVNIDGGKPVSGQPNNVVALGDSDLDISATVDPGYHFDGYSVFGVAPQTRDFTGGTFDTLTPDQTITVHGAADIMAHIEANAYTVQFDANGGAGEMEDQDIVYDQPQNLFANQFSRRGYVFKAWNTKSDGSGTEFTDKEQINGQNQDSLFAPKAGEDGKSVTLYAQWDPINYNVNYNLNDGHLPDGKTNPTRYTIEDSFTLNNPVREGYNFKGWTGTGLSDPLKTVRISKGSRGDRYYEANWEISQYTVRFESNRGSKVRPQTVKYQSKAKRPQNPVRKGYVFDGWYADRNLVKVYDFNTKITKDVTIYAKWKKNPASKAGSVLLARMTAKGKKGMTISWNKVKGAKGYDVYFGRCNDKDGTKGLKKIKTIKAGKKLQCTKTGLKKKKAYKAVVKAYTVKDGKKQYIKTSPVSHAYSFGGTKHFTNAKAVTVKKASITLKKDEAFQIKAGVTKLDPKKKLMNKGHAPHLRYLSTNKKIAAVSKTGKVKAKAKGTCKVYVYAHNGVAKAITVTVK